MSLQIDERRRTITTDAGGGGVLLLFGLVFAGFGGFFIYLLLTGGGVTVNGRPGTLSDAWMPGIFVLIGAVIGLSRYRKVIDLRRRTMRRSFRLVFPLWSREDGFTQPEKITLSKEVRGSGKNRTTVFPLRLVGGTDEVEVYAGGDPDYARRDAEALAKLAEVPLHDSSAGTELVRAPDQLDRSVLKTEEPGERPGLPASSRLVVSHGVRGVAIRVPPAKAQLLLGAGGFALTIVFAFLFWLFLWRTAFENAEGLGERLFSYAPLLMVALPAFGAISVAAAQGMFGMTLEVDRRELVARTFLGSTRMAADDIEELRVVGDGFRAALLVRSDEQSLRCGLGLSDVDREYLRASILYHLRGG